MTTIIQTKNTKYMLKASGWLTDGTTDFKYHCRVDTSGMPQFDNLVCEGDNLVALTHDGQMLVTSSVIAALKRGTL